MSNFVSKCCSAKLKVVYAQTDNEKDYWMCSECKKATEPLPTKNGFIPSIWPRPKKKE